MAERSAPWTIVVTGSESTGKTTLAHQLGEWLSVPVVEEFSRTYAVTVGRPLTAADVHAIAQGQIETENAARQTAAPGFVLDTDLVSTVVYARHYYGACPEWIEVAARERLATLYLLCDVDIPWEADGIRDQPNARRRIDLSFRQQLLAFGACALPVSERGERRLQRASAAVRGYAAAHPSALRLRELLGRER